MNYKIIAAVCQERGIGKDGTLPWKIVEDMHFFSKLTKGNGKNAIIMGKKTWDSFKGRHLIERDNLIISSTLSFEETREHDKIKSFGNIQDVHEFCKTQNYDDIWIIGGETIYKQLINYNLVRECIITYIDKLYECDTFFPVLDNKVWKLISKEPLKTQNDFAVEIWRFKKK
ncbi:dihydrofolate reductase [bacterium]|nr:dihydrofolate reductase [bacterium]|tara:strand:+ start:48 stop:563 length:516 start_codon:yes stop_codon:yes gene_type:complete